MKSTIQFLAGVVLTASSALANATLMLGPGDAVYTGTQTGNAAAVAEVFDWFDDNGYTGMTELYKSNVGGVDEKALAGSYDVTYGPDPLDPADALIEYVSGPKFDCPDCFLMVKDGNHSPAWYLLNLGSWDGMEDVQLTGFWPRGGAISHISIFSGDPVTVAAPGILAMLGFGLIGFAASRRRK